MHDSRSVALALLDTKKSKLAMEDALQEVCSLHSGYATLVLQ
jgi:hypothetical protein